MIPYPDFNPVLLKLGPLKIRWYGLMYVIGFIVVYFLLRSQVRKNSIPLDKDGVYDFLSYAALGVILGGGLGYVLVYNFPYYISHPLDILSVWKGGMSFHGGFVGVLVAGWLFTRKRQIRFLQLADLAVLPVPIGLFLGRIGNFINGELFGRETDVPWCMEFPMGGPICRHPSQLYEAFMEGIVLFSILFFLSRKERPEGFLFGTFIACYGLFRTIGEFFRQPDPQLGFLIGPVTMGQMLSVPMIFVGMGVVIFSLRKNKKEVPSRPISQPLK